jgi:hypothetical protein
VETTPQGDKKGNKKEEATKKLHNTFLSRIALALSSIQPQGWCEGSNWSTAQSNTSTVLRLSTSTYFLHIINLKQTTEWVYFAGFDPEIL